MPKGQQMMCSYPFLLDVRDLLVNQARNDLLVILVLDQLACQFSEFCTGLDFSIFF